MEALDSQIELSQRDSQRVRRLSPVPLDSGERRVLALGNAVLDLLALQAAAQVPECAARAFARMSDARDSRVLRVFPITAARLKDSAPESWAITDCAAAEPRTPAPLRGDADLARAIVGRTRLSVKTRDGGSRQLLPFSFAGDVRYVAEIMDARAARGALAAADLFYAIAAQYFETCFEAEIDPLTHLANRRTFSAMVSTRIANFAAAPRAYFLAVADIDHFKRVNDRYGHLYGDEILIHFARLMRAAFRADDLLFRFGGEEFVLVFGVERDHDGAAVLERFRESVAAYRFPGVGQVTVSVGFAAIDDPKTPDTSLIDRADQALYYAKQNGRNRVCGYGPLVAQGALAAIKTGEAILF